MNVDISDSDIVSTNNARYHVKYGIYNEEPGVVTKVTKENEKNLNIQWLTGACLGSLNSHVDSYKRKHAEVAPNRFIFDADFNLVGKDLALDWHQIHWWTRKCIDLKLMPSYTDAKLFAKTGRFFVNLDNISSTALYLYFCSARIPQENPHIVKNVRHLVRVKKLNFFIALLIACRWGCDNVGHSIMQTSRGYGQTVAKDVANKEINLREARGIRILAEKISSNEIKTLSPFCRWELQSGISKYGAKDKIIRIKNAGTEEALNFVNGNEV